MISAKIHLTYGAATDTGRKRKNNQDSWLIQKAAWLNRKRRGQQLFIVADGVGGAAAGEIASQMAAQGVGADYFSRPGKEPEASLRLAVLSAHEKINLQAEQNPVCRGMGSTLTALLTAGKEAYLAQVGDSRAYLIRANEIRQLTRDQTVTAELVAKGLITPEEACSHPQRHILVQALGGGRLNPEPDLACFSIQPEDRLVLCSDGLYNLVKDHEIKEYVLELDPQAAAEQLVDLANERGGTDNITVLAIKIGPAKGIRIKLLDLGRAWAAWVGQLIL